MSKLDFDRFVQHELGASRTTSIDWAAAKKRWIQDLGSLYTQVKCFVAEYVDNGQMTVEERPVRLNEEGLGQYEAPELVLRLGKHEVVLRPVGANIIAAYGAVEVDGSAGRARLVLVPKDTDGPQIVTTIWSGGKNPQPAAIPAEAALGELVWKVAERQPYLRYLDLDKDKFLDLFMEVVNA